MKFQGLYTAIVTPFVGNRVDEEAFRMLVEAQVAAGVAGIVAVGTTGESPTLTVKEHLRVIELAVESAAGRIQVVAGTGANSITLKCSFTVKVGDSPVVPTATMPATPAAICASTSILKASSSTRLPANGVTIAV